MPAPSQHTDPSADRPAGVSAAGTEPGERQLNGPQTTGRSLRNLSSVQYAMAHDNDVPVLVRDGARLFADVHRPDADGRFPALVAASPYPRQIQDLGAPMAFIEAGATDFWVPRGYGHVIANLRGTGGSDGTFGFFDEQERQDLHDLVEWVAAQSWCDGNVGMIGISYFAMAQLAAASQRPAHLKAIFPLATSPDLFEAARHNGLFSSSFVSPFLAMVGIMAARSSRLWRSPPMAGLRRMLNTPRVHRRFGELNGEAAVGVLDLLRRLPYDPHPWDDVWRTVAVDRPVRDEWWDERSLIGRLDEVEIPVYLGCDWENVPLHLPGTFSTLSALSDGATVRVALMGRFGLTWPWESLHVEGLAWFDHWLKGRDTGVLEGPAVRYWLPGAEEWRESETWPPPEARHLELALRADGGLAVDEGSPGQRTYQCLGAGLNRKPRASDPPSILAWQTEPLPEDLDMAGELELQLNARATAIDTAWIAVLQDVAPDGIITEITAGWLQASLRTVDEPASRPGRPILPCRHPTPVPIGELVAYRIPIVSNARRFAAGHRVRLSLCSDDQPSEHPTIMDFRHAPVGTTSANTVDSSSRLLLPVID
jgi:uncharacterized protein